MADGEDILYSPTHLDELLHKREFYLGALGVGLALGVGFSFDRSAKERAIDVQHDWAGRLKNGGQFVLWTSTGALYAWGLFVDDTRARETVITTLESVGIAALANAALKPAFGRLRPSDTDHPFDFWEGGRSFPSGAVTPMFALATGISEYADYRWWVMVPAYTAASAVGAARMIGNAHWLSDVIGSALLGVGVTKLMFHLHGEHEADPAGYRVFPLVSGDAVGARVEFEFEF